MLFSSVTFLYHFLPLVLLAYFVMPKRGKNLVLLVASVLFYRFGEPVYVVLLLLSSFSGWLHGLAIEQRRGTPAAKRFLISALVISLGLLAFFKYADFFLGMVNAVLGTELPLLRLPLPLGISFFTFQTISYVIDVYRGDAHAERNLFSLATFICLFPQLVAGPIVRYTDVAEALKERSAGWDDLAAGVRLFTCGLAKKILLANVLGELCAAFRASDDKSVLFYWLYAVAFTLQIYFDFSGYSDMAVGLGRLFGFHFPENFRYPYAARSITDFWRRWHITLGSWFRDYIYIPLGGNRVSPLRWVRNIAVVWLLTGLWHGAAWNFVLWGLLFGVLLVVEKVFLGKWLLKAGSFLPHLYVLPVLTLSFVLFNGDGVTGALSDLGGLFGAGGIPLTSPEALYALGSSAVLLGLAILGATPLCKRLYDKIAHRPVMMVLEPLVLLVLLVLVTAHLVDGSFNPFLYFRF